MNFEITFLFRNLETLMHLIKGNIGVGILAFPYALSKAGILVTRFFSFSNIIIFCSSYASLDQLLFGLWGP